jgi:ribonuclease R
MPRKTPEKYKAIANAAPKKTKQVSRENDPRLSKDPARAVKASQSGDRSMFENRRPEIRPQTERRDTQPRPTKANFVNPAFGKFTLPDPHAAREAAKYAQPIASRESILSFLSGAAQVLTIEAIADHFNLFNGADRDALDKRINAMLRDGQLLLNRRGGLAVAEKADLIPGTIIANADGFGFLRRDDGVGEDVFLAPAQMKQVLHGDRALVSMTGSDRRGKPEGMIVNVLERRSPKIVGRYLEEALFGVVAPDDRRIHLDIQIPRGSSGGAKPGDVVVAEITEPPSSHRPPIGRIVKIFGSDLGPQHAIDLAIESFDLPKEFPKAVNVETSVIPDTVEPWQWHEGHGKGRVDIRHLPLVTIDGEDARDFDDAVYCEPTKTGGFKLIVAIADVASYVKLGSALDAEALNRSTSVYFPARVIPMLPEKLSNGVCSLKPDVDRLCLACEMLIDAAGVTKRTKFYPAVMKSHQRLTYTLAWHALRAPSGNAQENQESTLARERVAKVLPQLTQLYALYQTLNAARHTRGAIEFEGVEVKFNFDETGLVHMVGRYERNDAHKLIEECMIAANVAAAKFIAKAKIPALYRSHASPPEMRYDDARKFLAELGVSMPSYEDLTPALVTAALRKARKRPDGALIEAILLRTQSLAVYSAENDGHFGLALSTYAHFTSPIRRYPDLLVHRAIYYALSEAAPEKYTYSPEKMIELGKFCSQRERRADEASRDVNERLKCAYLERHIGEDFDGIVTGVTSFGAFVELNDNRISGMVHVTQMPNDYYHYDQSRMRLWGERSRAGIRLTDQVRVKVLRVDAIERKIDFKLISDLSPVPAKELSIGKSPMRTDKGVKGGFADRAGSSKRDRRR